MKQCIETLWTQEIFKYHKVLGFNKRLNLQTLIVINAKLM